MDFNFGWEPCQGTYSDKELLCWIYFCKKMCYIYNKE